MKASIQIVGINEKADALALKAKLIEARRANAKARRTPRDEKAILINTLAEKESEFLAQGLNQA